MTVGELIAMFDGVDRGLPVFVETPLDVYAVTPLGWGVCTFEEDPDVAGVTVKAVSLS